MSPSARAPWRGLVAAAVLVLVIHAVLLGGLEGSASRVGRGNPAAPLNVRVVTDESSPAAASPAVAEPAVAEPAVAEPAVAPDMAVAAAPVTPAVAGTASPERRPAVIPSRAAAPRRFARESPAREKSKHNVDARPIALQASADSLPDSKERETSSGVDSLRAEASRPEAPPLRDEPAAATTAETSQPATAAMAAAAAATGPGAPVASTSPGPTLLLPGELPPPTYRPALPPALTLRYEVRSGFLRGTGELRWQPQGERYALSLELRLAGLTLLRQSSEGELDAGGLSPSRFLDQRARRSRQAANFRRDAGTITFSGPSTEWPLLAGSQDRLSFLIQLAGIVAGQPELGAQGAQIAMVVVGARGDAAVWTFRCLGIESLETGAGRVEALKFVRDARGTYDTRAEVWLDPARHHLPAHATLRNSAGASEYDLLLLGVDTATP